MAGARATKLRLPVCSPGDLAALSVPFDDPGFSERLQETMRVHGCVLVTGIMSAGECAEAERHMDRDWQRLLPRTEIVGPLRRGCADGERLVQLSRAAPPLWRKGVLKDAVKSCGRCQGRTRAGAQCTRHRDKPGRNARLVMPLRHGRFCRQHLGQTVPSMLGQGDERGLRPCRWLTTAALKDMGMHGMHSRGVAHGSFAWHCRRQQRVRRCFEILHGTGELCVSLDVPFFSAPAAAQASAAAWPHVDMKLGDSARVYQSVLYIWSAEQESAATTVVLPGSHTEFFERLTLSKRSSFSLLARMPDAPQLLEHWAHTAVRIAAPAGSLFLWDSRTSHQGWGSGARLAQPISWQPLSRRSPEALSGKIRMCCLGLPSTHDAAAAALHPLSAVGLEPSLTVELGGLRVQVAASLVPVALRTATTTEFLSGWRQHCAGERPRCLLESSCFQCL